MPARGSAARLGAILAVALIVLGVLLRLRQFTAGRSLWLDEAMLAINITDRSFVDLMGPLEYGQVAPIGFLTIEKLAVDTLGRSDGALRLFPLLAALAALPLMYRVGRQYLASPGALLALALFTVSTALTYYASEVKQYSSDVLVSLVLLWAARPGLASDSRRRDFALLAGAGCLALVLSLPAMFTLAGVALGVAVAVIGVRHKWRWLGGVLSLWAVVLGVVYVASLRRFATDASLAEYWDTSFVAASWSGIVSAIAGLLADPIGLTLVPFGAVVLLAGCIAMARRGPALAIVLIAPPLLTLAASLLGVYPFRGRLLLFLVPVILLLIGAGVDQVRTLLQRISPAVGRIGWIAVSLVLIYQPLLAAADVFFAPIVREHIAPVMQYVNARKQAGDGVYVYYGAVPAFRFYAPGSGFGDHDYVRGVAARENPQRYLDAVDAAQQNGRLWVVFAHNCPYCSVNEQALVLDHLDRTGRKADAREEIGAAAYLYERGGG